MVHCFADENKIPVEHDFNLGGQFGPVECKTRWPGSEIRWPRPSANGIPDTRPIAQKVSTQKTLKDK